MPRSPHSSPGAYRRRNLSQDRHKDPEEEDEDDYGYHDNHHDDMDETDFTTLHGSPKKKYEASPKYRKKVYNTRSNSNSPQDRNKKSPSSLNSSPVTSSHTPGDERRSPGSSDWSPASSDTSSLYPDLSDCSREGNLYPTLSQEGARRRVETSPRKGYQRHEFKPDREHTDRQGSNNYNTVYIIIVIVIALCFVYMLVKSDVRVSDNNMDSIDEAYLRELKVKNFTREMSVLQESYRKQDTKLWRVLRSATKRVLSDPSPVQPAVILLVSDQTGGQTMSCLAKSFTSLVGKVTDTSSFNVDISSLGKQESNAVKYRLDNELKSGFSHGSESVWLKDLQALDGTAAMLLHAYCDNENAPYKHATLVFTLLIDDVNIHEVDKTAWDSLVERNLENLWLDELGTDNLHALLSRLANNIAVVQPETTNVCN